tara:strand:- start:261 stop:485 length:225 start_codon:yes stop_codon:yes gene_type:complete
MKISRREKFVSLAEKRTANAIRQIKLIGNLSNRGNYEYTDSDISKIVRALNSEIRTLKDRFAAEGKSEEKAFKL